MKSRLLVLAGAIAASGAFATLIAAGGPPAFLTSPILVHVAEAGLDHGHFVFAEEAGTPAPLARPLGAAPVSGAQPGSSVLASSADTNATNASDSYEGETGAAANATTIVGAANHIYPGNCSASAAPGAFGDCAPLALVSTSGTFGKVNMSRVWNGTQFGIGFDPAVDTDRSGNFYLSYGVAPLSGSYPNAIVMMKGTPDGVTWTKLGPVTFNRNKAFDDKYYLAVDRSASQYADRIYVSWDRNQGNNQILYVAYSTNGGSTWSSPVKVNDGKTSFERVIGAYPAVDHRNGVVYDSWHDYAKNTIYVDRSTTGGASWGTDVAAAVTHTGFGKDIGCVGGRSQSPAHALKVGPSGTLYLVYADVTTGRGFDIRFTKSTNNGASWSPSVSLNDDQTSSDQFHPTLSVESNGQGGDKVTVTFYDRRDDSNNCLAHVYATQSTDNGATWAANVKLTSAPSNFDGNPNGPGDYSSSTPWTFAGLPSVWPFFSDHRNPDFEVYTGTVQ